MITADTLIADVLNINENAAEILIDFGMHCLGCAIAHQETVGEAAAVHGINLDDLLDALNNK
ncbi:MAG: DUF1858 domain-containing protein [Clostridia bacterium]|nr:DUF1858 domain-containing protein [Clostridia bacterium]